VSYERYEKGAGFLNLTAKMCTKCGVIRAASEFHARSVGDTLHSWCKACTSEYVRNKKKGAFDGEGNNSKQRANQHRRAGG